jgi:hypothetical protein
MYLKAICSNNFLAVAKEKTVMKKFITMVMALVLTFGLAVPAFAANEITANEQSVYDAFVSVVDKYSGFNQKSKDRAAQYKTKAEKALLAADLNKKACDDLKACVARVEAYIDSKNPQSAHDMLLLAGDVVNMVNDTANQYGIKVSLGDTNYSSVMILKNGKYYSVEDANSGSSSGKSPIVQTGYDLTATVAVAAMLIVAVGACFVVIGKKNLVANAAE